ncbi:hypothetical protein GCM10025866_01420 [Naasia aerilata]|uniref:Uncharacterized protein n=1 Tax=Naasia aerilata TaxID=1162966 RepID=A0ABN6XH52_9MICO|nr:hypothetical protein GCM10025866_01420 [Naasia aerilata]
MGVGDGVGSVDGAPTGAVVADWPGLAGGACTGFDVQAARLSRPAIARMAAVVRLATCRIPLRAGAAANIRMIGIALREAGSVEG